jgi:hypothetical protein
MGLDMYLTATRYFWFNEEKPTVDGHEIKRIETEAGYWRKANQIHRWFVENVQHGVDECQSVDVGRVQLKDLRDLCKRALETENPLLLPPQAGFFFGTTGVGQDYWDDIRETIEVINKCFTDFTESWDFTYRSSW